MYPQENNSSIHGIPVLTDNIIWIWIKGSEAVVIDPAIAKPVISFLNQSKLNLIAILQTHHHEDHIGGTRELLGHWPNAEVVAAKADLRRIPFQTISVKDNDQLFFMNAPIKVIDVAGHTKAHVAYYMPPTKTMFSKPTLFCGDTLFGAGCGRIFEGTADKMYEALQRINKLPENTQIYCAHEYTKSNLEWAISIYPKDMLLKARLKSVEKKLCQGSLSLPSNIKEERKSNLFLRAKDLSEFTKLRLNKDSWRG